MSLQLASSFKTRYGDSRIAKPALAQDARPKPKVKLLAPIHANAGTEVVYRRRLDKLIQEMNASVKHWLAAAYKANEPVIAQDELPADALRRVVRRLARQWQRRFNRLAPKLAEYFAEAANARSSKRLADMLAEAGFTVKFKMTRTMQDVMNASINEQVGLIKSIPQKYFTEVEGLVMRSVQAGRDLGPLTSALENQYGVTRRRAALIARDQNNKMTSVLSKARQQELGITEAIWLHSAGGKEPRPKHVAFSGKRYKIAEGAPIGDKGQMTWPGFEINCRCVSRAIIPGL